MPTYEYRCQKCGEHFEVFQSFSDEPLTKHDKDGGKVSKVLSAAGVILKGSGFYKTDNRNSSKKSSDKSDNGDKSDKSESSSSSSSATSSGDSSSSSSSSSGSGNTESKSAAKSA
jgi:putative FmdB family regulatory protein